MNVLELFAGSRSIGEVADMRGHDIFSVDIKAFKGINLVKDIEFLEYHEIPFKPDMIWASPPCTTYSIAAISHHRDNGEPKSAFAVKSDRLVMNTLDIIHYFGCPYYIENPRGYLRKMRFMRGIPKATVTYCSYGDSRMKPTDIWSNNINGLLTPDATWHPKTMCHNNNPHCNHERAPRGSRTGTQGLSDNYERSKIPQELAEEIIKATELT